MTEEASGEDFVVGGQDRQLTEEQMLSQLVWYLGEHHPTPPSTPPWQPHGSSRDDFDAWMARLPDRLTHASMMLLGTAVDHTMPGTHVDVEAIPVAGGFLLQPEESSTDAVIVGAHCGDFWRGGGVAQEFYWHPEVAELASQTGCNFLDCSYPLYPAKGEDMTAAIAQMVEHARARGAKKVFGYGACAGAMIIAESADLFDAIVLTRPRLNAVPPVFPDPKLDAQNWPPTMIQVGTHDDRMVRNPDVEAFCDTREYVCEHMIAPPVVARKKVADAAEFFRTQLDSES